MNFNFIAGITVARGSCKVSNDYKGKREAWLRGTVIAWRQLLDYFPFCIWISEKAQTLKYRDPQSSINLKV